MKTKRTLLFFIPLFFSACGIIGNHAKTPAIAGQWQWIKTAGGFAGTTITPDSAGPQVLLNFSADNQFSIIRADSIIQAGHYTLNKKDGTVVLHRQSPNNYITDQEVSFKNNDTLILSDLCTDCYISTYQRIN